MALCKVCQNVPFSSLPEAPGPRVNLHYIVDDRELIRLLFGSPDGAPVGFPWHPSLEALAIAAQTGCPICVVVQGLACRWMERYQAGQSTSWKEFSRDHDDNPHGRMMWLTKRSGGSDGFTVFVSKPRRGIDAALVLGGVSFSVEPGSPLATTISARPFQPDSGSLQCLDVAAAWLTNCHEKHQLCSNQDSILPARILDLNTTIKLIEPAAGTKGRYACLSHCWGPDLPFSTTRESYDSRKAGISISELPRTFSDAIQLARHIGIRYLWIDSLCIFQEDLEEWGRESARVVSVYSEAYVVIAAGHARASNAGCFHTREPRTTSVADIPNIGQVKLESVWASDERNILSKEFPTEPLSSRAWALQERVLAKRIIHYNTRQMYFECNHGIVSEDGCQNNRRLCDLSIVRAGNGTSQDLRQVWHRLLWHLGQRHLTKPTDKLPSMSGLANIFQQTTKGQYVAGLWANELIHELAWQGLGLKDREPESYTEYTGPSWSWASYKGIAAISDPPLLRWKDISTLESWHVELRDVNSPFGEVKSASIRVRGPFAELEHAEKPTTDHDIRLKKAGLTPLPCFRTKLSRAVECLQVAFDDESAKAGKRWRDWTIYVLILGCTMERPSASESEQVTAQVSSYYGLVVARMHEHSELRRVGWGPLDAEEGNSLVGDENSWQTVTLV
ncbi:heterokaryon incompatibility protein-domain-containing protein [Stachybotrys elegans]|uniref:Heterokaryon incompatibility protein-domain-containing protein n=1 Tax=Stachybotrys elegans TaxID=80388 RepID=A0A8K0WNC0_9HYPO|nr:heterokaryon incompatibility protein-domain-containing protein [Stachybotrys elegans]